MGGSGVRDVEVMRSFWIYGYEVKPGSRLLAWKGPAGWNVIFNGAEVAAPQGAVGELDSPEVKQAAEERKSAREEEYQLAPSTKEKP